MPDAGESWLARHRYRGRIGARDGWRLVSLIARTLRTAIVDPPPRPCLALLAGPTRARQGSDAVYVVRVCNPTARPAPLLLVADGATPSPNASMFHGEHAIDVAPGETADFGLSTSWDGRVSFAAHADDRGDPVDVAQPGEPGAAAYSDVHVRLLDRGTTLDHLHVRTALLA